VATEKLEHVQVVAVKRAYYTLRGREADGTQLGWITALPLGWNKYARKNVYKSNLSVV
jgi:hypothetical protein